MKASIDAYNAQDVSRAIEYESESIVVYSPEHPKGVSGRDSIINSMTADFVALPDIQFNVERIIGQGDEVSVRGFVTGTNTGPLMTAKGRTIKASKRRISISQAYFHRLQEGKIVETHSYWDTRTIVAQLGFLRKNVFKAFAYIFLGLALMIVNATVMFISDPVLQFISLIAGAFVVIISGALWMGRTLLELGRN